MIDVVGTNRNLRAVGQGDHLVACVQSNQVADRVDDVFITQQLLALSAVVIRSRLAELLIQLVATDASQVVALRVLEQRLDQTASRFNSGGLARTELPIEIEERLILVVSGITLQRVANRLGSVEEFENLLVGIGDAEGAQERTDVLTALAIDANTDGVALVGVELQPGAATRDHLAGEDVAIRGLVTTLIEIDAG